MGGADAVAARVAAADDQHVLAAGGDALFRVERLSGQYAVLLRQHLHGEVDAREVASGDGEVACLRRAGADGVGVEAFGQAGEVYLAAGLERDALGLHDAQAAVDDVLAQLEVRYAVAQQSARLLVAFEDGHFVATAVQLVGGGQSGGARTDDGHAAPVAFVLLRPDVSFAEGGFDDGGLVLADGDGGVER